MDPQPRPVLRRPVQPRMSTAGSVAMVLFALLAGIGVLVAVGVVGAYRSLAAGLPDPERLEQLVTPQESVVYDRTGQTELARFGVFQREIVTFDQIPGFVVDATTAIEDKSFWTNPGFDPAAILSAGLDAIRGNPRGASTITQQLVRQRLLDEDLVQAEGRQIERKLKEIIQSIRVTRHYQAEGEEGKQRVIAIYMNSNFYGNNSYGIKAAARGYFGVENLEDLTLAQAAILAAIPQSPSRHDLVRNAVVGDNGKLVVPPDTEIVQRRNVVLDLMSQDRTPLSTGQFGPEDYAEAKEERVELVEQQDQPWIAQHFVWAVREELALRLCGEDAATCNQLEEGGYRITSTVDLRLQEIAEKWVKAAAIVPKAEDPAAAAEALGLELEPWMEALQGKDLHNGALVAMDYQTGELVAYVGSADYNDPEGIASPQFQPQFDVVADGWRQPGSAFKPFNYLMGLDSGQMTAATMFMDVATDFGGDYSPTNADNLERGPLRLRSALQFSLNIPSVKAVLVNQPERVYDRVQDFGLRFRSPVFDAGASLALGVEEVRPVDLVTGYGTIANLGTYTGHTTILRVQKADGSDETQLQPRPEPQEVANPQAAAIIGDILGGNTAPSVNPFWGRFRIMEGEERRPAALKTGPNNDAKDLNAYGFIGPPSEAGRQGGAYALAVGAWNGNSDNTEVSTPENPVFSVDVSTYVWQGFLTEATQGWEITPLSRAEGLVSQRIDPWTGLLPGPGEEGVNELFMPNTVPTRSVGGLDGICGEQILQEVGFEHLFDNWMAADRDWMERAKRGPGTVGGPDRTRVTYFYNGNFNPYGRSWGPLFNADGCGSPAPSPSCFPIPTPNASGVVPSFAIPSPTGSGVAPLPCPTPSTTPSPSPSPEPSEAPTPPPTEPPETPRPTRDPGPPTPDPTEPPTPAPTPAPSPAPSIQAGLDGSPAP